MRPLQFSVLLDHRRDIWTIEDITDNQTKDSVDMLKEIYTSGFMITTPTTLISIIRLRNTFSDVIGKSKSSQKALPPA